MLSEGVKMRIKTKLPFSLPSLLIIAICFALVSEAGANAGIPGPLIIAGGSGTANPLQWIAANSSCVLG